MLTLLLVPLLQHWIAIDLQDDFWVTTVNVFAGRDTTGDGSFEPDHPICSYTFEYWAGQSEIGVYDMNDEDLATFATQDAGWTHVFHSAHPTTQESHSSFPAVNARYVRMRFDQSLCPTVPDVDNYVRLYELQVLAAVPSEVCSKTVTVSGAGTSIVNGVYFEDGTSDGVPKYTLPPRTQPDPAHQAHTVAEGGISILRWSDGMWYISGLGADRLPADGDDLDYYSIRSTADTPPTTWACSVAGALCEAAPGDVIRGAVRAPILTIEQCDTGSCNDILNQVWAACDAEHTESRRSDPFSLRGCGNDQSASSTNRCHQAICYAAAQSECFDEACAFRSYQWYINDAMQQCHSTCRLDYTNTQSHNLPSCDTEDGGVLDAVTAVPDYGHREVAWWNLDSDSVLSAANEAASMTDQVSHHDGQLVGAVSIVYDPDPARGYVLQFDGNADHPGFVEVPPSPAFNLNEYTVMFWMKAQNVYSPCHSRPGGCAGVDLPEEPKQALVAHGESFDEDIAQYVIFLGPDTRSGDDRDDRIEDGGYVIQLWSEDGVGTDSRQFSHTTPISGAWTHVAVTRGQPPNDNNQGMDNKVMIFIDGRREIKNLDIGLDQVDIDHILTLGCRTDRDHGYRNFFQGRLDSVRLFSENMQSAFVRQIHGYELHPNIGDAATTSGDGQHGSSVVGITCDIASIQQRVAALHSDCCSDGATCDGDGRPSTCTARCSSNFMPFHAACSEQLRAIDPSIASSFDEVASSCTSTVFASGTAPGCSYADFFPIILDCADESDANDDDPSTHGPPLCESECRSRLEQFESDCGASVPHDDSFLATRYRSLVGRITECNGLTPTDSGLLTSNCILVNHLTDDNYDATMHAVATMTPADRGIAPITYNGATVYRTPAGDLTPGYLFKFSDSMWVLQPLAPSAEWLANDYCNCEPGSPCDVPIDTQCTGWRSIEIHHCNACPLGLIAHVCPSREAASPTLDFTAADVACDSECAHVIADTVDACEVMHDGTHSDGTPITANPNRPPRPQPSIDALKPTLHAIADQCSALVEERKCHETANDQAAAFNDACCGGDACVNVFLPDACNQDCAEIFMPFFSRCGHIVYPDPTTYQALEAFEQECAVALGREDLGAVDCGGKSCEECTGSCGWCSARGGVCSSECVSTDGECDAYDPSARDSCAKIRDCGTCEASTRGCSWCTAGDTSVCSSHCDADEQRSCDTPDSGYTLLRHFAECRSNDMHLGDFGDVADCADACAQTQGCRFFVYGLAQSPYTAEDKSGRCWYEFTTSPTCAEGWEPDSYDFYELTDGTTPGGAQWPDPGGGGH
jgi:hypothetical protein